MDDISEQLARRDRFQRRLSLERTPAERMQAMARFQEKVWQTLRRSPEGYAHFLRRNFKALAVSYCEHNG